MNLFLELAAIPSPSGDERSVADWVKRYLADCGLAAIEDAVPTDASWNTGNLLARIEPTAPDGVAVFLCAHLDTVPATAPIEPVVVNGVVRNGLPTILGADNKAAVAVMLEAARAIVEEGRSTAGVELLFTSREETGCDGAKAFDRSALHAQLGYVYDHAGEIGGMVQAAPTHRSLDVRFQGRSAHAGFEPEHGRSAIKAAASLVSAWHVGQLDAETTVNIGTIVGGTERNVVPAECVVRGELRSHSAETINRLTAEVQTHAHRAASHFDCQVEVDVCSTYDGYRFRTDELVWRLGAHALERCGFEPHPVVTNGGADANYFNTPSLRCVNMSNGMKNVHTSDEHIAIFDLDKMLDVTLELVASAAAYPTSEGGVT